MEPSQIGKLRHHAVTLACELQRPPTKKELKDRFDPPKPPISMSVHRSFPSC